MRRSLRLVVATFACSMLPACQAHQPAPSTTARRDADVAVLAPDAPRPNATPREDAHVVVLLPRLPPSFAADDAVRLQRLIDEHLGARSAQIEARGARAVPAALRDRILSALANGKLAPDGPTCGTPASPNRVMRALDAPADLAVARAYVTKNFSGRDVLLVEVRVGGEEPARLLMALTSELDGGRDLRGAVAKLDDDPNAPLAPPTSDAPAPPTPATDAAYVKALCAQGLRPRVEERWIPEIDHGPLPYATLHRCVTKGRPEKLTVETEVSADVTLDLAADGRVEALRVSRIAPDVAACLESTLRRIPFSCPAHAGTMGGTLKFGMSSSNTPGCAPGLGKIGAP